MNEVRNSRLAKGWTQTQLAEVAGTPRSAVSAVETGKHQPWPAIAQRLSDALGIPIKKLFPTDGQELLKQLTREEKLTEKSWNSTGGWRSTGKKLHAIEDSILNLKTAWKKAHKAHSEYRMLSPHNKRPAHYQNALRKFTEAHDTYYKAHKAYKHSMSYMSNLEYIADNEALCAIFVERKAGVKQRAAKEVPIQWNRLLSKAPPKPAIHSQANYDAWVDKVYNLYYQEQFDLWREPTPKPVVGTGTYPLCAKRIHTLWRAWEQYLRARKAYYATPYTTRYRAGGENNGIIWDYISSVVRLKKAHRNYIAAAARVIAHENIRRRRANGLQIDDAASPDDHSGAYGASTPPPLYSRGSAQR